MNSVQDTGTDNVPTRCTARRSPAVGAGTRKGLLVLHIASAGAWLGIDLAMAVLIFTAEQARRFLAGEPATLTVGDLIFPPIVSPTALLVAMVLAVFKPWGRIRAASPSKEVR